jgi:hypothetical protein
LVNNRLLINSSVIAGQQPVAFNPVPFAVKFHFQVCGLMEKLPEEAGQKRGTHFAEKICL